MPPPLVLPRKDGTPEADGRQCMGLGPGGPAAPGSRGLSVRAGLSLRLGLGLDDAFGDWSSTLLGDWICEPGLSSCERAFGGAGSGEGGGGMTRVDEPGLSMGPSGRQQQKALRQLGSGDSLMAISWPRLTVFAR